MTKHTCKNCNSIFEYCRGCLLSPIPYKDAGYCSKSCYEASKNKVESVVEEVAIEEVVETISTEDIAPIEENIPTEVEAEVIVKEDVSIETEVETEVVASVENIPTETTTVAEPTTKKETYNTYKKKKHKYR